MTLREKVIQRLNNGFGYEFPEDVRIRTHQGRKYKSCGADCWYISDIRHLSEGIGCSVPMSQCLKWKRWVISKELKEIDEYVETMHYDPYYYEIEKTK